MWPHEMKTAAIETIFSLKLGELAERLNFLVKKHSSSTIHLAFHRISSRMRFGMLASISIRQASIAPWKNRRLGRVPPGKAAPNKRPTPRTSSFRDLSLKDTVRHDP